MEQVMIGGFLDSLNTTATEYNSLVGGKEWDSDIRNATCAVSTAGVIKNLRVKLSASPGGGKHYDFTLMLNGAPTALTLEIADAATSGSNMVNEIDVVAGDYISLKCVPDNTPAARIAAWTSMFEGSTANESLIPGVAIANHLQTRYARPMGASNSGTTENDYRQVIPTAGTIKNLYIKLSGDPGTDPDAYRFTLRLNGATVAQSLIVTIVADDTTGNDVAHNLAVVAGDVITMMIEPLNSPSQQVYAWWGMTFLADTNGESFILGGAQDDLSNGVTEYHYLQSGLTTAWGAEAGRWNLGQECTLKNLYMLLSGSPGAGNSYDFTVRVAGASGNVTVHIHDTDTTGNSAALTDTVANDNYLGLMCVPLSSPTVRDAYWGLVGFIAPPAAGWTGKISGVTNPAKIMGVEVANIATVKGIA